MVGQQMSAAGLAELAVALLVLWWTPTLPSPLVNFTASGFHRLNAFTGAADQLRHDEQWQ
jgi:hypothetical protein